MSWKSVLTAALCAVAVAGGSASAALAGEVKGPPGTGPRTQEQVDAIRTAAPAHSNSICSYSGLNDMIVGQGPIDFHVQSPGQNVRTGETPPGIPGVACHGGSNPENP
ncbi:MAG TPA: hypothetical protein VF025_07780 [Gaiellaceae bacterium]